MFHVVAFSGSLRQGSSNTALLHLARRLAPAELSIEIVDWLRELPYYDPDLEADVPPVVGRLRTLVGSAQALLIGMPEYNFGPSALAKNTIDWLSRPIATRALEGMVIAMLTSGGKGGGANVQAPLQQILGLLGNTVVAEPAVQVAMGATRIAADGSTDDAEVIDLVTRKMANLVVALRSRATAGAMTPR